jgi:hypothetical protein
MVLPLYLSMVPFWVLGIRSRIGLKVSGLDPVLRFHGRRMIQRFRGQSGRRAGGFSMAVS